MVPDLFTYLPSEIMIDILLRLPIRTVMRCKCVCKSWLDLLVTPEFVKSHLSNSAPGLATFERNTQSKTYKIVEFVDEVDLNCHESRWNVVFDFDLPFDEPLHSSANGLLFHKRNGCPSDIFLCNPITREYIKLPSPRQSTWKETYGFGVSRMSGQYKVVRIFLDVKQPLPLHGKYDQFECQVYTVGTGSWRRIASDDHLLYKEDTFGAFLNGNLHWFAYKGSSKQISCFDLETELVSTLSPPPRHDHFKDYNILTVLGDCICSCNTSIRRGIFYDIEIWLMKEYGEEKSWAKEFVIGKVDIRELISFLCPIKVFKDGDILLELGKRKLLYYSSKIETTQVIDLSRLDRNIDSRTTIYAPTFLSLKTFGMENVF